jgi:carbon storage regulator
MLYLTRRPGEAVIINNAIEVRVVELKGKSVKLGFTFPPDATVLREEVFLQIKAENEAAVAASADVLRARSAKTGAVGSAPAATRSAPEAETDDAEDNSAAAHQVSRRGGRSSPIDRLAAAGDRRRPEDS